ncbi:putative reverse transcriptase domain-containing protein [Tanacetum coccineum]
MQNERVERVLYWTRVRAHEFYQEMIHRGFVFEERPNEAIDVSIEDEKKIMPPKSVPMTQAAIRRVIKESVDAAFAAERARQANVRNDASGSRPVRGRYTAPVVRECTFAGFMKCNLATFRGVKGAIKLRRWFKKTESVFEISECAEGKKVKFTAATLEGPALTWQKTKVATMVVTIVALYSGGSMSFALMCREWPRAKRSVRSCKLEMKEFWKVRSESGKTFKVEIVVCARLQAKEIELELTGVFKKFQGNIVNQFSCGQPSWRDIVFAELTKARKCSEPGSAPTDGKLPLCERCFTRHVCQCMIKCHKYGKVRHKTRYYREKSVATGANAQCGARAYAIKDAESKGPNVVTGTFLLNNRYASVLFDSGSDRSFVNTRFSSLLDIKPIKIEGSYEVELADGRVVSTNTVLKGCTLSLVNHVFEIDLMLIELCTFDVIIGIDWLVKHDVVIICGEKVICIPYGNKTLIVKGDKGVSRLKVISCIKARKYIERGCHLFLVHVTESKSKEKRIEDVLVIHDFPKVFPEELPGLPPPRQVEF